MLTFDLLIPWITLALTIIPLLWVQRWIHRHLFGMGYLISRDKGPATLLYYSVLMPGVFLHEFSQYLVAGMFAIRPKRFAFFPEAQDDGSLEMGFVQLEDVKNPIFAAIIGIAPLLTGIFVVVWVSNNILDLPFFFSILRSADFNLITTAFHQLTSKPDFWLWTYILFAVANAMMPNKEDRRGWWVLFVGAGAVFLFMIIIGMQKWVAGWLAGPIADALYSISAVFSTVLAIDFVAMAVIWVIEHILERVTGHKVQYAPALPAGRTAAMLGSGVGPKSVFDLRLPIPPAPGKVAVKAPAKLPAGGSARPGLGSGAPANQPARPAFGTPNAAAATQARPTFNPAPKPGSAAPAASTTGSPSPGAIGSRPGAPTPNAPGSRPASPLSSPGGARPATSATGAQPAKPAGGPISGPPALRTNQPVTPPARPGPATPVPKPGTGPSAPSASSTPKPGGAFGQRPRFGSRTDDDYIEGEVVDDEDDLEYVDDDDYEEPDEDEFDDEDEDE